MIFTVFRIAWRIKNKNKKLRAMAENWANSEGPNPIPDIQKMTKSYILEMTIFVLIFLCASVILLELFNNYKSTVLNIAASVLILFLIALIIIASIKFYKVDNSIAVQTNALKFCAHFKKMMRG